MLIRNLLIFTLLAAAPAQAAFTFRDGYVKVIVNTDYPNEVTFSSEGARLWNYSAATLLYLPANQLGTITGRGIITTRVLDDTIHLAMPIDPRVGLPASVPASQRITSYPAGKYGAYVIQFIGPPVTQWLDAVAATGATRHGSRTNNAYIYTATPEMLESIRALPYVQFADFLHPALKLGAPYAPAPTFVYHEFGLQWLPAPDLAEAKAEIASFATPVPARHHRSAEWVRVRAEDVPRLFASRLLNAAELGMPARPRLLSVFPRRAAPGSVVTISGRDLPQTTALDFDGVPVVDFTRTSDERIRARVPALTPGSHSLRGQTADSEQILAGALTVDAANGRSTIAAGDIVAVADIYPLLIVGVPFPIGGNVQWLDPNGAFQQRWRTGSAQEVFFDPQGFLNVVTRDGVVRYDASGNAAGSGPAFAKNAKEVVYDRQGRATVFGAELSRYAADGTLIRSIPVPANLPVRRGDLAADGCTFYAAQANQIAIYDLCSGATLPPVALSGFAALSLRVAPDGTLVALDSLNLTIARTDGTVVRRIFHEDYSPQMAITPDGASVILVGETKVQAYDFATGALRLIRAREPQWAGEVDSEWAQQTAVAIYGGWSAANANPPYAVDPAINNIANGDGPAGSTATINGSGFQPGARVFVNGIEATVTNVSATQITFIIPAGMTPPRNVTVVNPNGQNVVFGSNVHSSHLHAVPALDWRGLVVLGLLLAVAGMVFLRQ